MLQFAKRGAGRKSGHTSSRAARRESCKAITHPGDQIRCRHGLQLVASMEVVGHDAADHIARAARDALCRGGVSARICKCRDVLAKLVDPRGKLLHAANAVATCFSSSSKCTYLVNSGAQAMIIRKFLNRESVASHIFSAAVDVRSVPSSPVGEIEPYLRAAEVEPCASILSPTPTFVPTISRQAGSSLSDGAEYVLKAHAEVSFPFRGARDDEVLPLGNSLRRSCTRRATLENRSVSL